MKHNEKTSNIVDQKKLLEDKVKKARANEFENVRTNNTNGVPEQ
ncbi:hypothetical protein [Bacillus sp. Marseille-P3661]|nr:hypothetical protein [Bacillus sp. Marseille-P3661]